MEARFILNKERLLEQYNVLKSLGLNVSYSYKTNRDVGNILQDISDSEFSIHDVNEINFIKDKSKIWFFLQANPKEEIVFLLRLGVKHFVIDNELDLNSLLFTTDKKINISIRMKFQEHRVGSGKYFVYGLPSEKVNSLILKLKDNPLVDKLGVHLHRKSQNTSEWNILSELKDSLSHEALDRINIINFGGGLPVEYKSYTSQVMPYIFAKLREAFDWLKAKNIKVYIEPGRFLAAPCIKLEAEIIQIYENNIIINTTIYNSALDTILTNTKLLVQEELKDDQSGQDYLIKGNSPTRDDIFRYKVKLLSPKVGDKITFLNAGAYNYSTDFFGYKKLKTIIQ